MPESISYIIGAYNEEQVIEKAVRECHFVLQRDFSDFELILVNDGSRDRTGQIMEDLSKELSNTHVLHNLVNLNFGVSILRGLKYSSKDIIIYNAADLPLSPENTLDIVSSMSDCDLLVLERDSYPGTRWRKLTSSINLFLLRILFPILMKGTPIVNFTQAFRSKIIDSIMPLARSPIFVWPELIFRGKLKKDIVVKNKKVPVNRMDDMNIVRKGAFGNPHDIIWGMSDMLRFRFRLYSRKFKRKLY